MKKIGLLTLILFISTISADTIIYEKKKLFSKQTKIATITNVDFLGVSEEGVHYKSSWGFLGNKFSYVKCLNVIKILDKSDNEIEFSCEDRIYLKFNDQSTEVYTALNQASISNNNSKIPKQAILLEQSGRALKRFRSTYYTSFLIKFFWNNICVNC